MNSDELPCAGSPGLIALNNRRWRHSNFETGNVRLRIYVRALSSAPKSHRPTSWRSHRSLSGIHYQPRSNGSEELDFLCVPDDLPTSAECPRFSKHLKAPLVEIKPPRAKGWVALKGDNNLAVLRLILTRLH